MAASSGTRALRGNQEINEILNQSDSYLSEYSESRDSESHPSDCECGWSESEFFNSKNGDENEAPASKKTRVALAPTSAFGNNNIFDRPVSPIVQPVNQSIINNNQSRKWSNGNNFVPKTFEFDTSYSGIPDNEKLPTDAAPVDYFKLIWQASVVESIAMESNKYITQVNNNPNFSKKCLKSANQCP
jgi:hypothetical protein